MIRRPPRSTRTDTLFPYTTLFRSSSRELTHHLEGAIAQRVVPHDFERIVRNREGETHDDLGNARTATVQLAELGVVLGGFVNAIRIGTGTASLIDVNIVVGIGLHHGLENGRDDDGTPVTNADYLR